jgi:signal transduction histidine kinase
MSRKIVMQVTAPAVLIGLATVAICVASLWSIHRLQGNLNSILSGNVTSLEAAAELEVKLRQLRLHMFLYVMDPTPAREQQIAEAEEGFEAALAVARRSSRPEDIGLVADIETGFQKYRANRPNPTELGRRGWTRDEYLAWADAHPVQPLLDGCQELMRRNREAMEETARESARVSERTETAMSALAILGPVGGLVAGFGIARGLSRSIAQLRVRVEDVRAELDQDVGSVRVERGGLGGLDAELAAVTARVREVVEQAQRREREALRAEQLAAVGQLAAGVAHEVRNPLVAIKLLIEAALAGGELTADDLRVIHGEVRRLERAAQGLLDFARPAPPRREAADLRAVVGSAVDLVRGRAGLQNVRVEVVTPADPVVAAVDVGQIQGVLVNLLLNALDAMPGGGRVTMGLGRTDGAVMLTVRDTGPGIRADVLPRLFEPFASTRDTGTGLGLHVSRRVVREHGGDLSGANDPGGGAVFTITLPGGPGEPGGRSK